VEGGEGGRQLVAHSLIQGRGVVSVPSSKHEKKAKRKVSPSKALLTRIDPKHNIQPTGPEKGELEAQAWGSSYGVISVMPVTGGTVQKGMGWFHRGKG